MDHSKPVTIRRPPSRRGIVFTAAFPILAASLSCLCGQNLGGGEWAPPDCWQRARGTVIEALQSVGVEPADFILEAVGDEARLPPPLVARPAIDNLAVIDGMVRDSAGAVLPDVTVELITPHRLVWPVVESDAAGRFRFEGVEAGEVTLRFQLRGFKQLLLTIRLEAGEARQIWPSLELGDRSEQILVSRLDSGPLLPQAILRYRAVDASGDLRLFQVHCHDERAFALELPPESGSARLPLRDEEVDAVLGELQGFYRDLFDLAAGPRRMRAHVSGELLRRSRLLLQVERRRGATESGLPPDDLEEEQLRDWIAVVLGRSVVGAWRRVEGCLEPHRTVSYGADFRSFQRRAEEASSRLHRDLESRGLLSAERLSEVETYLRLLLGEGLIVKQRFDQSPAVEPADSPGVVYKIILPELHLFFGWREGRLRLVYLLFD